MGSDNSTFKHLEISIDFLSVRALIALSIRCLLRTRDIKNVLDSVHENESEQKVDSVVFLLLKSFCKDGLNKYSRVWEIYEDSKWSKSSNKQNEKDNFISDCLGDLFQVTLDAAFTNGVAAGWVQGRIYRDAVAKTAHVIRVVHSHLSDEQQPFLAKEICRDIQILLYHNGRGRGEIGNSIDPLADDVFGPVWNIGQLDRKHLSTSCTFETAKICNPRSRLTPRLFKFVNIDGLMNIIQNKTLKFSIAENFNDPFDSQILSKYPFTRKEFIQSMHDVAKEAIQNKSNIICSEAEIKELLFILHKDEHDIPGDLSYSISKNIAKNIRPYSNLLRPTLKFAIDLGFGYDPFFKQFLDLGSNATVDLHDHKYDSVMKTAASKYVRILCLTEEYDNLLMWAHYGDHHRGAVIELDLSTWSGSLCTEISPVSYHDNLPESSNSKEAAEEYLGVRRHDHARDIKRLLFTKSSH